MILLGKEAAEYVEGLVPARHSELQAMEAHAREARFPIIGPVCGHLCYQIARMIGARRIFELGSGFGYSTAWFARAVQENGGGTVFHTVWDEALSSQAKKHLETMGFGEIVQFRVEEAVKALQETPGSFDLIFNDIDKQAYPEAFAVIREKLRPGGALIVDNMWWGGDVLAADDKTPETEGIRTFTRQIMGDPAWVSTLIPIRDGLLVGWKAG